MKRHLKLAADPVAEFRALLRENTAGLILNLPDGDLAKMLLFICEDKDPNTKTVSKFDSGWWPKCKPLFTEDNGTHVTPEVELLCAQILWDGMEGCSLPRPR